MRKVLLLVGIAIAVFMVSTLYGVHKELQSSAQLAAIKDSYFPVLERLDANIVRVDKVQDLFMEAASTGDGNIIPKADELVTQTGQVFTEVNTLYPGNEKAVATLQNDLQVYRGKADEVAHAYVDQNLTHVAALTREMNATFARLRTGLSAFRTSSYDGFVRTLADTQRNASVSLFMGVALGLMNLAFMAVLVHFIRTNMKMMRVIEESNASLERRVAERTAQLSQKTSDINAMLQNMHLGVNTVILGNTIHPEYSNYLRTIFSIDDVGGQNLVNALFAHSDLGVDAKDQMAAALDAILGEDLSMFDFNGHLLPREVRLTPSEGGPKIVQMDWTPIANGQGQVEKILLITQDVTQLRELERSSAEQRAELDIIAKMIRVPIGKFNDFARSAGEFVATNRGLIQDAAGRSPEVIAALFRNMHTIKGNARTFELTHITDAAHTAEQSYDVLRKDPAASWDAAKLNEELNAVESAVNRYVRISEDTLGRKGRAGDLMNTRGSFVSWEKLAQLRTMAAALAAAHSDAADMQGEIDRLGLISLERLVSGSVDSLASLARELCKPVPELALDSQLQELSFNPVFAEAFKSCLMHILRNSLDHGIESPEDRQLANKAPQGTVRIESARREDGLELQISDDGRGLALQRLYELGVANGMFQGQEAPSPDMVAETIFKSGVSTASEVTQVSGRGVGMDAVRSFLAEQGATIRIALREAVAATGFTPFAFVIRLPRAVESY